MGNNKAVTAQLKRLYGLRCMLTGELETKGNRLTFHHLEKRCEGGGETVENGSLILGVPHENLHCYFEKESRHFYDQINLCIQEYKLARMRMSEEHGDLLYIELYEQVFQVIMRKYYSQKIRRKHGNKNCRKRIRKR